MSHTTRQITLALTLAFVVSAPVFGASPYQATVSEIMEQQRLAALQVGPRPQKPRLSAPRRDLPLNPASPDSATLPATAAPIAAPSASAPQTLGVSFLGATLADTNSFPPDTMGAAGPTQFLVGVNGRIRTFDKSSGTADGVLNADMDVFFNSVRNSQPTSDPRVRYDRLSGRWFVTIINFGATFSNNRVLIAATDAASNGVISNATVWTFYYFQHNLDSPAGDTGLFLDYDTLGVDANGLVIGGNIFDPGGNYQGTSVHVVRKSAVLSGGGGDLVPSGNVVAFRNLTGSPGGAGPYTPQGVDNLHDAAATDSWVIGVDNATFGTLMLREISFSAPGAWPPTAISANVSLAVSTTFFPLTVPHLGNTGGTDGMLDALDDRLFDAKLRNGHIWTAHNITVTSAGVGSGAGDRNGSRWYEIDVTGTPSVVQSGTLFDPAASNPLFYWIPSIAVSGQGHAAIGTSTAGVNARVNASTAGRLAGDPAGTLQSPLQFTSSSTAYNPAADPGPPRRWGDYSYTSVDPDDDMTMWTIQEYCNATDSYGVRVVELVAPAPATPTAAAPNTVAGGLASAMVTITGASSSGSGFFDPGAGYPNRIQASVSGGDVTVNGVTYNGPTSVTLDVSTVGAAFGPRTVTITNPDGQSATSAPGILDIVAGGPAPTVTSIAPTSGPAGGGTAVTITGTNFVAGASATFGGVAATGVNVTSEASADATSPILSPGTLNAVAVINPDAQSGSLPAAWLADFLDVPQADIFHDYVEKLFRNGVTAGCGAGAYCRDFPVTRAQMAVFLLKAKLGSGYAPPPCTGMVFNDVPCTGGIFDPWIEDLAGRGITGGCGGGDYCPANPVTRAQMAVFLLKTDLGSSYVPPACTGTVFNDVPCTGGIFDPWIEDLAGRNITGGCGGGNYCPADPNTRGQMAVFLVKTFDLP
jgi:hypothetical protein